MLIAKDADFYAFEISDNLSETEEGYLLCLNVPIARTGVQKYLGQEIGLKDQWDKEVKVYREPADVFHPDTLASFEAKAVVDDHPTQPVLAANHSAYAKGHAQNIRSDGSYIIADLVVTDPILIAKIKNKNKREVSAGYNCEYVPFKDGFKQVNIRANHVAVVDKGRAGPKVSIKDQLPARNRRLKPMNRKDVIAQVLHAYAKDASAEEFARAKAVLDAEPEANEKESEKEAEKGFMEKLTDALLGKDKKDAEVDPMEQRMAALEDSISQLKDAMTSKAADSEKEEEGDLLEELLGDEKPEETKEAEEKEATDAEETEGKEEAEEKKAANDAAMQQVIQSLKPAIAKLPAASQKIVKDALRQSLNLDNAGKYAAIQKAAASHGKTEAKDSNPADPRDIGRNIAKAHNPHFKDK